MHKTFEQIIKDGNHQALKALLEQDGESEVVKQNTRFSELSILHLPVIIRGGHVECLELLLSYNTTKVGPVFNKFNKDNVVSLLTLASSTGNLGCVKTMLDFVKEKGGNELSVLPGFLQASLLEYGDCAQEFLTQFPRLAAYENDVHIKKLLKIHGDVSGSDSDMGKSICFSQSIEITNLLDLAARSGDTQSLQELLEKPQELIDVSETELNRAFNLSFHHRDSDLNEHIPSLLPFNGVFERTISEEKVSRVLEIARSHAPEEILELCSNFLEKREVTLDTDHLFGLATPFVGGIFADNCRHKYQDDHTLLVYHLLCRMNRMDCLKKLLKAGVNPDIIDTNSFRGNDLAEMKELLRSSLQEDEGPAEETDRRDGGAAEEDDEAGMHQVADRVELEEDFQAMNIGTSAAEKPQLMGNDQPPADQPFMDESA